MSRVSIRLAWGMVILAGLIVAFAPIPVAARAAPVTRAFRIQANQFSYSPSELKVNRGDTVTILLTSTDAVHGLYLDGYDVSVQADPGQTASLTFVANKPGSFRFRCNVTCGALHPFLIGKLTVGGDSLLYRSVGITLLGALGLIFSLSRQPDAGMIV